MQNNAPVAVELSGLSARVEEVSVGRAKFDLSVSVAEERGAYGSAAGISGVIEYASDLFDRGSVEALGSRLVRLLEGAVAAPDVSIGRLEIVSSAERRQLLEDWNATGRSLGGGTIVEHLAAAAAARPDAVAAVFEEARLSYGELEARANQLAHHLRALGVGAEKVVGVCLERQSQILFQFPVNFVLDSVVEFDLLGQSAQRPMQSGRGEINSPQVVVGIRRTEPERF